MKISNAKFLTSAPSIEKCPGSTLPEFAFIGRSNVGKSSLINMLCNRKGLAKTSALPGKTLLINLFNIDDRWTIVDLPGYGYAKRSKKQRDELDRIIRGYLMKREQLYCVFLLIDVRLEMQPIDREFVDWLGENGIPFVLVFTKCDKLNGGKHVGQAKAWLNRLKDRWEQLPDHFLTSSQSAMGREQLLDFIEKNLPKAE